MSHFTEFISIHDSLGAYVPAPDVRSIEQAKRDLSKYTATGFFFHFPPV